MFTTRHHLLVPYIVNIWPSNHLVPSALTRYIQQMVVGSTYINNTQILHYHSQTFGGTHAAASWSILWQRSRFSNCGTDFCLLHRNVLRIQNGGIYSLVQTFVHSSILEFNCRIYNFLFTWYWIQRERGDTAPTQKVMASIYYFRQFPLKTVWKWKMDLWVPYELQSYFKFKEPSPMRRSRLADQSPRSGLKTQTKDFGQPT